MTPIAVKGGIGDFLQCLPSMLAYPDRRYLVASHYDRVPEFFAALGLEVEEISLGRLNNVGNCERRLFFGVNPFPRRDSLFTDGRPVLGVHLGGSTYSLSVEKRFGFPPKALPIAVLDALIAASPRQNILLFGSSPELDALIPGWRRSKREFLKFVADDVTASLSRVAECSNFIGSDSAFKTMSAMLRIPTVVWIGDYRDDFRDSTFINPYVKAGIMSVFRYRDLGDERQVRAGVKFSQEQMVAYAKSA